MLVDLSFTLSSSELFGKLLDWDLEFLGSVSNFIDAYTLSKSAFSLVEEYPHL